MSSLFPSDSPSTPKPGFELELLKQEYFFLQTTIEDYNKQIWVIKALGIIGTSAVIALALQPVGTVFNFDQTALIRRRGSAIKKRSL